MLEQGKFYYHSGEWGNSIIEVVGINQGTVFMRQWSIPKEVKEFYLLGTPYDSIKTVEKYLAKYRELSQEELWRLGFDDIRAHIISNIKSKIDMHSLEEIIPDDVLLLIVNLRGWKLTK